MHRSESSPINAEGLRVAIVASSYHHEIVDSMRGAACELFLAEGGAEDDLVLIDAPGAFELVSISSSLARQPDIDAVVALGCVIRGETSHDQWINSAVSQGLAQISVTTGVPVAFGVLTCHTMEQALDRSGGSKGNKGEEAMRAAVGAVCIIRDIENGKRVVER